MVGLIIENDDNLDLDGFSIWLMSFISNIASDLGFRDYKLEELWYDYFNSIDLGWPLDETGGKIIPSFDYIFNSFFNNLIIDVDKSNYIITINPNFYLNNSNIRVKDLIDIINEGNLSIPKYQVFEKILAYFTEDLQDLYEHYLDITGK